VSGQTLLVKDASRALMLDRKYRKGTIVQCSDYGTPQLNMVYESSYTGLDGGTAMFKVMGVGLTANDVKWVDAKADVAILSKSGALAVTGLQDYAWGSYNSGSICLLGADIFLDVAGTTGQTVVDVNYDGTTCFSSKPTVVGTARSALGFDASGNAGAAYPWTLDIDEAADAVGVKVHLYYTDSLNTTE
jgi:hypothetical protein